MIEQLYSVKELAQATGVTQRTIRFYEAKGLLCPRKVGATRVFAHRDLARMQLILRGKRLGFSLAEIGEYLDLYDQDPSQASQVRHLLERARERIGELESQRRDIDAALSELLDIETQALDMLKGSATE